MFKLTPINEEIEDLDELKDTTTAGLVQYGLRTGCLDSEYHLALRLQEMREALLELSVQTIEEGFPISDAILNLIDVEREVVETKRYSKTT